MKNCGKCGISNADEAVFCSSCGAPLDQASEQPAPAAPVYEAPAYSAPAAPTYETPAYSTPAVPAEKNKATLWLILNIVLTVLCCGNLFGIIGIVFAAIGMGSYNKGDYEDMNKKVKISMIMFIVGIAMFVIGAIIVVATGLIGAIADRSISF